MPFELNETIKTSVRKLAELEANIEMEKDDAAREGSFEERSSARDAWRKIHTDNLPAKIQLQTDNEIRALERRAEYASVVGKVALTDASGRAETFTVKSQNDFHIIIESTLHNQVLQAQTDLKYYQAQNQIMSRIENPKKLSDKEAADLIKLNNDTAALNSSVKKSDVDYHRSGQLSFEWMIIKSKENITPQDEKRANELNDEMKKLNKKPLVKPALTELVQAPATPAFRLATEEEARKAEGAPSLSREMFQARLAYHSSAAKVTLASAGNPASLPYNKKETGAGYSTPA